MNKRGARTIDTSAASRISKIVCLFAVKMWLWNSARSLRSVSPSPHNFEFRNRLITRSTLIGAKGREERNGTILSLFLSLSPSHRFENVIRTIDDSINRGYSRVNRVDRDYFIRAMNAIASGKICIIWQYIDVRSHTLWFMGGDSNVLGI